MHQLDYPFQGEGYEEIAHEGSEKGYAEKIRVKHCRKAHHFSDVRYAHLYGHCDEDDNTDFHQSLGLGPHELISSRLAPLEGLPSKPLKHR